MHIHVLYALHNVNKHDSKTKGLIYHAPLTAFYNAVVKLYINSFTDNSPCINF